MSPAELLEIEVLAQSGGAVAADRVLRLVEHARRQADALFGDLPARANAAAGRRYRWEERDSEAGGKVWVYLVGNGSPAVRQAERDIAAICRAGVLADWYSDDYDAIWLRIG